MSDHVDKTVASFQEKIKLHEDEIVKLKKGINQVLDIEGRPPLYPDAELQVSTGHGIQIRADEFFNKPLATSVRTFLERRQTASLGAAPLDDIFDALIKGGYDPENSNVNIAKRNVAISLSKNPAFIRLKNDTWGIREWYGIKAGKKSQKEEADIVNDDNKPDEESENS